MNKSTKKLETVFYTNIFILVFSLHIVYKIMIIVFL